MAVVKVLFRKNAARTIGYVFKDKEPGGPVDADLCSTEQEDAVSQFKSVRDAHNFKGGWQAVHVIQSFSMEDTKKLLPEEVNQMGKKLVQDYWKGHQFLVVTHTNTDKIHNHIIVNILNMETGRRINNKTGHWKELCKQSDALCVERGLRVLEPRSKSKGPKIPEKARQMMEARGAHSYIYDIMRKADVAREVSTSYDEYRSHLSLLKIGVQIENKNITYFYPGIERGKRGDKLGESYHKPFLEKTFKANDEKFQKDPSFRARAYGNLESAQEFRPLRSLYGEKDYSKFTPTKRGDDPFLDNHRLKSENSLLPFDEIKRAQEGSIIQYCRSNKVELVPDQQGWHRLKGRNHVLISETTCKNEKSRSSGGLIDFVAAHHQISILQAVAKINQNPRLLLLEEAVGGKKPTYQPFYVPKGDRLDGPKAKETLSRVLRTFGGDGAAAEPLLRNKQAQVTQSGVVHIFAKDDSGGAFEFKENDGGGFSKEKKGDFTKPFFSSSGKGKRAVVFLDPFSVTKQKGSALFWERPRSDGILALMEPKESIVDHFLIENRHVSHLSFVTPAHRPMTPTEIDLFENLKKKYHSLNISVEQVSQGRAFHREGHDLSR